jgi:hypothetical protein
VGEEGEGQEGGGGKVKCVTEADVASGVYGIGDVVLPLPGKSVR